MSKGSLAATVLASLLCTGAARAASFDCTKATTRTEKLICSNPTLSKADEVMAAAYKKALAAANSAQDRDDLRQDQVNWVKYRVAECGENPRLFGKPIERGAPCIAEQYQKRTAALGLYASRAGLGASQASDPTGTFEMFGVCLSCGGASVSFLKHPDGNIAFALSANNGKDMGDTSGAFALKNNRTVYNDVEGDCSLLFTFTPTTVKIEQQKGDCGFGYNVHAEGFYLKISNAAPKIDE